MEKHNQSKRAFLKTIAYVAPVIATFSVAPAIAGIGSHAPHRRPKGHAPDCDPSSRGASCAPGSQGKTDGKHQFFSKKDRFFSKPGRTAD